MLEAIVSTRYQGETATKLRGDILAVKLSGSPWTREEKSRGLFIEWADEDLAARLLAMVSASQPHPVISYPYATYDEAGGMLVRSTVAIDIDAMGRNLKRDILDPLKHVTMKRGEYIAKERGLK